MIGRGMLLEGSLNASMRGGSEHWQLTDKAEGKTRTLYVPARHAAEVTEALALWKEVVEKGDNILAIRLLQLLQWDPKSPAYLRTTLGIASREYFTKAYLRPLTEAGLIARTDPDHPNSPRQKYALTKAGSERIRRVAPL